MGVDNVQRSKRKSKCCVCGKDLEVGEGRGVRTYKGLLYLCDSCSGESTIDEAFSVDETGTSKAKNRSVKIALECKCNSNNANDWLLTNAFKKIGNGDDSIYVSPNWNGLAPISKLLRTIDEFIKNEDIIINGYAPIYLGVPDRITSNIIKEIQAYYLELFSKMADCFQNIPAERQLEIIGCVIPNEKYVVYNNEIHNGWIQTFRDYYIEISTCKYRSREQYLALIKILRSILDPIDKWIDVISDDKNIEDRIDDAKKCGNDIAKKVKKSLDIE